MKEALSAAYDSGLTLKEDGLDILAVATIIRRLISFNEITSFIRMPDGISDDRRSLEEIISLCGLFLTIREQTIYFVHQLAKDFLFREEKVNHDIFSKLLYIISIVLRRNIYSLKAPGFSIDQVSVPNPDLLASVRYLCIYWIDYLYNLISSINAKWVYLLKSYGQIIQRVPLQVYLSAFVFAPIGSLIKNIFKEEKPGWLCTGSVEMQWNACTQTLEGHRDSVWSVAFSLDGQRVASGSGDKTIKIWDTVSGTCTQTLEGHGGSVWSVAFSPDGQRVASGSGDKTIKIWDAVSGTCSCSG
ncbi:WD40-repeat-containing domain protein [Triangularia verruculosa]|uniref:WD40-repeat-containing domain protein n=1 Tax=Triangularia verruculosa TaxID=2587418 RepID=A0AAN6XLK0_9PEZI|nr:WD40-repeat-containing domain protein [Triangularia verruculosa]